MTIRTTYTKDELIGAITQNLDQSDDPEWIAKMATKIIGPRIEWNEKTNEYEEHDD